MTLGYEDGGGANGWSHTALAQLKLATNKCSNVKVVYTTADFDVQKAISNMTSLVAQGANAIVTIPDAGGPAELPAIRQATAHGVKVVVFASRVAGSVGSDYDAYVDVSYVADGRAWATWVANHLHGKGNVVFMGGTAGGAIPTGQLQGIVEVFKNYPNIHLLTGTTSFPATNFDEATAKTITAGLITKYPKIDAMIIDDGQSAAAAVSAFQAAGRPTPLVASKDVNQLGCLYHQLQGTKSKFGMATVSANQYLAREAARKAIAAYEGLPENEKSLIVEPLFEDSFKGGALAPHCDKTLPADAFLSDNLTDAQLAPITAG